MPHSQLKFIDYDRDIRGYVSIFLFHFYFVIDLIAASYSTATTIRVSSFPSAVFIAVFAGKTVTIVTTQTTEVARILTENRTFRRTYRCSRNK